MQRLEDPKGYLDEGYRRLLSAGPEWGESVLTNHGPMAVEVLARHGHGEAIEEWLDAYIPRLDDLPAGTAPIRDDDWRQALGDNRRVADWTTYFSHRVQEEPWKQVLALWWPRLLPGIAAGTTHGVIRVSHAVRVLLNGSATLITLEELAHGLAFWAARFHAVPGQQAPSGSLEPGEALDATIRIARQAGTVARRFDELAQLSSWPQSQAGLASIPSPERAKDLLAELTHAATVRYLQYGHASPILLVHTATAPNAVLHCLPALPQSLWAPSAETVWTVTAAIVATYAPAAEPGGNEKLADADDAQLASTARTGMDRAVEHGDEHVIKFTDTALEVFDRTGDQDAARAASHVARLIAPQHSP